MWEFAPFLFRTLPLTCTTSTLGSMLIPLVSHLVDVVQHQEKSMYGTLEQQPTYPSLWRHFSQNAGTCWELNWPPTALQSLSPLCNSRQILPTPYFIFFTLGLFSRISLAEEMWLSSAVRHCLPGNLIIWQSAFHCCRIVLNCFHSGQTQRALPADTDGVVKKIWSADIATCRQWLTVEKYPL